MRLGSDVKPSADALIKVSGQYLHCLPVMLLQELRDSSIFAALCHIRMCTCFDSPRLHYMTTRCVDRGRVHE